MEKYKSPFFGTESLTSTSANHIANIAKEYYQSLEAELEATNFVKEEISIVGSLERTEVNKGTPNILSVVDDYLNKITAAKALIAWLREAIKLKNQWDKELNNYVSEEYAKLEQPTYVSKVTELDVLATWDIKDRERYLTLETECAVIGGYIHPSGAYSKSKKKLFDKLTKPVETSLQGRDTIIKYYTGIVSKEDVETKFFELQKRHRSVQAELNSLKTRLENEVSEKNDKISRDYMNALDEYKIKRDKLAESDKLYVQEERKKIEKLRIIIPPHHMDIYNIIRNK